MCAGNRVWGGLGAALVAIVITACGGGGGGSSGAPTLTLDAPPGDVARGETAHVTFHYTAGGADVAFARGSRTNALGETAMDTPAAALGITADDGTFALDLATATLPFGESTFTLHLTDAESRDSNEVTFVIDIVGAASGGAAPTISALTATPSAVRPAAAGSTVAPRFTFDAADPDADLAVVRLQTARPDGTTTVRETTAGTYGLIHATDHAVASLLELASTDPAGTYTVTLTLYDENANASAPASVDVDVRADATTAAPSIASFTPTRGAAATEVTLTGGGFATTPADNTVTLDRVPVEVTAATATTLTVLVPAGASTASFVVATDAGHARSTTRFEVPASIAVTASAPSVEVGGRVAMTAVVVSSEVRAVEWLVDGTVGGSSTVGTITSDGIFTAARAGRVTIAARVLGGGTLTGALELPVLAPEARPDGTLIAATTGGTARSVDGAASIDVPPGALADDARITVVARSLDTVVAPPAGRALEGAVTFGPDGLTFATPATAHVPLRRYMQPGRKLALRQYLPATETFADDVTIATVDQSGLTATAPVRHFSVFVLEGPDLGRPSLPLPTLSAASPATGVEGTRVPVRLTGTNLRPELDVHILRDGAPTTEITAGPLFTAGTEAGVLLDIGVLPDLDAGATRTYTISIDRPLGAPATTTFTVTGLDEWTVAAGATVTDPAGGDYSSVDIAGTVRVTGAPLAFTATHSVTVSGTIDGQGDDGESAAGAIGGLAIAEAGSGGGAKERGANAAYCLSGTEPGCDVILGRSIELGVGGAAGESPSLLDAFASFLDALFNLFSCLTSVVNGSLGSSCAFLIGDIVELATDIDEIPSRGDRIGRGGAGGGRSYDHTRSGGGGGGGGGDHDLRDANRPLETFVPGGGGGAGGEPGHGVTITSGRDVFVDATGTITTAGGRGGDGGAGAYPGGGGGGGAAGQLTLTAARRIVRAPGAIVDGSGGPGGHSGRIHDDASGRDIRVRAAAGSDGVGRAYQDDARAATDTPIFSADLDTQVTNRAVFADVRVQGNTVANGRLTITIRGEQAGQLRTIDAIATDDGDFSFNAQLYPGLNTVSALAESDPRRPLLDKRILVVFGDADADGLTDADEAVFGTDPNDYDSDGDGVPDGLEVLLSTPPASAPAEAMLGDLGGTPQFSLRNVSGQRSCLGGCALNDAGQVVGTSLDSVIGAQHALLWDPANPPGRPPFPEPIQLGGIDDAGQPTTDGLYTIANAINAHGVVVGSAIDRRSLRTRAVLWDPSVSLAPVILGDLGSDVSANAINNGGVVVGSVFDPVGLQGYPAVWTSTDYTAPPTQLPTLGSGGAALGVGEDGVIVGIVFDATISRSYGAVWNRATPTAAPVVLGDLGPGSLTGEISGFNELGQVVGTVFDPARSEYVGALWDPASPTYPAPVILAQTPASPPPDPDLGGVIPRAINVLGQIVGQVIDRQNGGNKAAVWTTASPSTPPTIPSHEGYAFAYAVNDAGALVGEGNDTPTNTQSAYFWAGPLAPHQILRTNSYAFAVNATGAVLGNGYDVGSSGYRSFLWTAPRPVPTLSTIAPTTIAAGSDAITLTVNGASFTPSSRIRVDGIRHPTTFVSSRRLTTVLTAEDLLAAGTLAITVVTPNPGGGPSSAVSLTVTP